MTRPPINVGPPGAPLQASGPPPSALPGTPISRVQPTGRGTSPLVSVALAILLLAVCGLGYGVMDLDNSKVDRVDASGASGDAEAAEIASKGIDPRFLADKIRDLEDKIKRLEEETAALRKNARSGPSLPGLSEVFGGGSKDAAAKDGKGGQSGGGNSPLSGIRKLLSNVLGGGDPKNMTDEERKAWEERRKQMQQWGGGRRGGRSARYVDQFVNESKADLSDEQRKAMSKVLNEQLKAVAAKRDELRKQIGGGLSREQEENIRFEARRETDNKLAEVLEPDQLSDFTEWRRERDDRQKAEEQRRQEKRRREQEKKRAQKRNSADGQADPAAPGGGQGR